MPTRNTGTIKQIIEALSDHAPPDALERLETHFKDSLIVVAGSAQTMARHAEHQKFRNLREQYAEDVSADVRDVTPEARSSLSWV